MIHFEVNVRAWSQQETNLLKFKQNKWRPANFFLIKFPYFYVFILHQKSKTWTQGTITDCHHYNNLHKFKLSDLNLGVFLHMHCKVYLHRAFIYFAFYIYNSAYS